MFATDFTEIFAKNILKEVEDIASNEKEVASIVSNLEDGKVKRAMEEHVDTHCSDCQSRLLYNTNEDRVFCPICEQ